ncbi:NAD-dependent epimerase/dehydratase family protein [Microbacterium sp. AG238]|uniref:NAD-dependent epimerase/dehydratase family protein n=1 Tax=Microbacterium sp. AG238 TaxID=2183994 RepID=UPI000E714326|nr:NAD-dependent epimerase/dehydratase family protein [Microbacterium sp. AG238]RKE59342.1 UDP-glucuronate 4-epimerase [Microbacterium sp. AG238]
MKYFVTGAAGFVGFHLCRSLLADGHEVYGFDGMTQYYDPALKRARLDQLLDYSRFVWTRGMLEDRERLLAEVEGAQPDVVVHLAAQAGVRYSIDHPESYIQSNLVGTANVLEAVRRTNPSHFLFASTSSVYGGNTKIPFSETDPTRQPLSLYAATKQSGEAMSHSYSHLFNIPTTCFRFFTVYGPWGRPDMALFKFVEKIENGEPIQIYGDGRMSRDFTYIDDLVKGIRLLAERPPATDEPCVRGDTRDSVSANAPWRIVNIAGGRPVGLLEFVDAIERSLGIEAVREFHPMQPGDVRDTRADAGLLSALTGFVPTTTIDEGVDAFVQWFRSYRGRP